MEGEAGPFRSLRPEFSPFQVYFRLFSGEYVPTVRFANTLIDSILTVFVFFSLCSASVIWSIELNMNELSTGILCQDTVHVQRACCLVNNGK